MNAPEQQSLVLQSYATSQLLVVQCGGRLYGIDLQRLHEIRRGAPPPQGAAAKGSVPGTLNLRGEFVPLLYLRARLGLPLPAPGTRYRCCNFIAGCQYGCRTARMCAGSGWRI